MAAIESDGQSVDSTRMVSFVNRIKEAAGWENWGS